MCHRLQVGATRASDARQVDCMCKRVKFHNSSGGVYQHQLTHTIILAKGQEETKSVSLL